MAFGLPISLDLTGRRAVVVGGGEVGEQKARALLDAGAAVTVIAERFVPGLKELARRGEVTLAHKPYTPGDLEGAFLAVAATNSPHVNRRIYEEAEERRVLLNAVDDVPHCHFAFPAILRRGDLRVAVSTGGRAPALAKWLRGRLSQLVGPEYGDLVSSSPPPGRRRCPPAGGWASPSGRGAGSGRWTRISSRSSAAAASMTPERSSGAAWPATRRAPARAPAPPSPSSAPAPVTGA